MKAAISIALVAAAFVAIAQTNLPVTTVTTTTVSEVLKDGASSPQPDGRLIKQYYDIYERTIEVRVHDGKTVASTNDVATNRAIIKYLPVVNRAEGQQTNPLR